MYLYYIYISWCTVNVITLAFLVYSLSSCFVFVSQYLTFHSLLLLVLVNFDLLHDWCVSYFSNCFLLFIDDHKLRGNVALFPIVTCMHLCHFSKYYTVSELDVIWHSRQRFHCKFVSFATLIYKFSKSNTLSATTIHTSCTGSRLISVVNLVLAGLVLRWEITWE